MGKWQCSTCSQKNDLLDSASLDTISKRARTKIVSAKSKSATKSFKRENVPQIFGNSIVAKKRSSCKGKSILMHGVKSSEKELITSEIDGSFDAKLSPPISNSIEGISSFINVVCQKVPESPMHSSMDKKSISPPTEVMPHSQIAASEVNQNSEVEFGSKVKHNFSCDDMSPRKMIVLAITATKEESRKRKHKANNDSTLSKCKINKGKSVSRSSKLHRPKASATIPRSTNLKRKHKSVSFGVSKSFSGMDIDKKISNDQGKIEVSVSCIMFLNCMIV